MDLEEYTQLAVLFTNLLAAVMVFFLVDNVLTVVM